MMGGGKRKISVSDDEHRVMIDALNARRNDYLSASKPTEDVSGLLLKVADTSKRRRKVRGSDARS